MAQPMRRGKNSNVAAPHVSHQVPGVLIMTLHPEGSQNNIQYDAEARRSLVRPHINYALAALNILIPLLLCFAIGFWSTHYGLVCLGLYFLFRLRGILVFFIHIYQRYASADIRLSCLFRPTCSEYMILALEKYGVIAGLIKGINRLLRCRYPNGGEDYP
jgi:putative membrane protein insertion efficiency factor